MTGPSFKFGLSATLLQFIHSHVQENTKRTYSTQQTSQDECMKLAIAAATLDAISKIKKPEDLGVYAESYGLTTDELLCRSVLDTHCGVINAAGPTSSALMHNSSAAWEMKAAFQKAKQQEQNIASPPAALDEAILKSLSSLTFELSVSLKPAELKIETSSSHISFDYDLIDFNHRSQGRWAAYQYCLIFKVLKDAGIPIKPKNDIFMGSETMILERIKHAKRVYSLIRVSKGGRRSAIDIAWFRSIFTSDNPEAMEDVLQEIEDELWYLGFLRSAQDVPQYHSVVQDRSDIFELLVALQGHVIHQIRTRAVVLMNMLLDDHEWQSAFPLLPQMTQTGDSFSVSFTMESHATDGPPEGVFLQLCAPPAEQLVASERGFLSYHPVDNWQQVMVPGSENLWKGSVNLGQFTRCGYYDWRVTVSSKELGSWDVVVTSAIDPSLIEQYPWIKSRSDGDSCSSVFTLTSRMQSSPVQGRFICQKSTEQKPVLEYKVADLGAEHVYGAGSSAGPLVEAIHTNANKSSESHFNTIMLRGATEHRNRSPPCVFSGSQLAQSLTELKSVADDHGIDVCIEASFRVSTKTYDRKYKNLKLNSMVKGRLCETYGAAGPARDFKDTKLLNYRDASSWTLFRDEVLEWLEVNMASGIVIEGLGYGVPVYSIDGDEMAKMDRDGMRHYSDEEILKGKVVLPLVMDPKGEHAQSFPDPFMVYICRALWAAAPQARIVGETVLTGATDIISRSGCIPYVRSLLPLMTKGLGKNAPDATLLKAEWDRWARTAQPSIQTMHKAVVNLINRRVPGASTMVSTISPGTVASYAHLEGSAWPFIAWLCLLPIQQSFSYVEKFNKNTTDFPDENNYYLPYIVRDFTDDEKKSMTDILNANQRARSFIGSVKSGVQNPHSPQRRNTKLNFGSREGGGSPIGRACSLLNLGKVNDINSKIEKVEDGLLNLTADANHLSVQKKQDLASVGCDTSKFSEHIEACLKRGHALTSLLKENSPPRSGELYVAMNPNGNHKNLLCFARVMSNGSFAVCAVNFGDQPEVATVSLQPLHQLVVGFKVNRKSNYIVQQLVEGGRVQAIDMCTLLESVNGSVDFTLPPGEVGFRVYSIQDQTLTMPKRELYRFAYHRLVTGAREAQTVLRRQDRDATKNVARALNSNALVVDLINSLQERNSSNKMAEYLKNVSLVIDDLYTDPSQGYNKFLGILLDLGVFSTSASIPIDESLRTGTKTSLAKLYSLKIASIAAAPKTEAITTAVDLAQVMQQANGLGPIVFCTSEYGKFSTVGGLGVMVDELASTLAKEYDQEVWVISPYYHRNGKGRENHFDELEYLGNVGVQIGSDYMEFGLHYCMHKNVRSFFIHHMGMYPMPYPDNRGEAQIKFLTFTSKAMLETICWLIGQKDMQLPELVVSNDWPTGMLPAHARSAFGDTFHGTTFYHIVHNLDPSYEGRVWCDVDLWHMHGINTELLVDPAWRQKVYNPSRCAILSADSWGTVSPSYRNELLGIGCHSSSPLQPLLARKTDSFATPNGVPIKEREESILNRMKSCELIPNTYEVKAPSDWIGLHFAAKDYIQHKYFGFDKPDRDIPLCAFVGRITSQKGVHLICQGAEQLIKRYNYRIQFLIGGMVNWSDPYSAGCGRTMLDLRNKYPYCFWCGPDEFFYDGSIINVGTDIALMPSAFEPGGIVQHEMFAGGTPVLAFKTGGLRDTVHEFQPETNTGSGWTFEAFNLGDYLYACERAVRTVQDTNKYTKLRLNAKEACISSTQVSGKWLGEFTRLRRKFNVPYTAASSTTPLDAEAFQKWFEAQEEETKEVAPPADSPKAKPATPARVPLPRIVAPTAKVRFVPAEGHRPRNVAVCGAWSEWTIRHPMYWNNATGAFVGTFQCKRGSWGYKIICDGNWQLNPEEETCDDEEGNLNSVLYI